MVLQVPLDRATHRALRAVVLEHRETERRRRFPPTLHVGLAGQQEALVADPRDGHDAGLRTDLALALLQRVLRHTPAPLVWLTRPGDLHPQDPDLLWGSAVDRACESLGIPTGLVVVTRRGWCDPASGRRREWRRLRRQPTRAGADAPPG